MRSFITRHYVRSFYEATQIYLQSRGIAWFDMECINKVVNFLGRSREFVSASDINRAGILNDVKFSTPHEAGYMLKLLWYLGFARAKYQDGKFFYTLSTRGREYYRLLCEGKVKTVTPLFYKAVTRWRPVRTLLSYMANRGEVTVRDIVKDLGGDMLYWTKIMRDFGFRVYGGKKGVRKPYNKFVVRNCLFPIAEELGLVERFDAKFRLTSLGREVLNAERTTYEVIRSRPKEPFIYAAICDTLLFSDEAIIVSPWIDVKVADNLVQGIELHGRLSEVRIIVREPKPRGSTKRALKLLHERLSKLGVSIKFRATPRRGPLALHAKVFTTNERGIITSANLQYTSLWNNFEMGVYFKAGVPLDMLNLLEDLWESSRALKI